jgi:imidazolonepropionase-like amidohydrolase
LAGDKLLANAMLLDCAGGEPVEGASVVVKGDRILSVRRGGTGPIGGHDVIFDCAGMTLMPGLTDAHVHIGAVDVNILEQHASTPTTSWR